MEAAGLRTTAHVTATDEEPAGAELFVGCKPLS
jgi:hypothetical protein